MTFLCQHCNTTVNYALAIAIDKSKTYWNSSSKHPKTETWCLGCIIQEGNIQDTKNLTERITEREWNR